MTKKAKKKLPLHLAKFLTLEVFYSELDKLKTEIKANISNLNSNTDERFDNILEALDQKASVDHRHPEHIKKSALIKVSKRLDKISKRIKFQAGASIFMFILSLAMVFVGLRYWSDGIAFLTVGIVLFICSLTL